eukprot:CAMPEP_0173446198 /NCGR_PEP_ID=MMETSP1357-20121228/36049_1 /TAXON_ID=77926 /ORGANISM="Hemiselmis rufescens, Strain PCC563" /LENGTH=113 /DNA_ID=CAMNT_0014412475 /DNA_START=21 /DNA_END=359 /DNA_ORIENTATION=-
MHPGVSSMPRRARDASEPEVLGGVGIVFMKDDAEQLYVHCLVEGGSAHQRGCIQQGDLLAFINDCDIRGRDPSDCPPLSGPENSSVVLGFIRVGGAAPSPKPYYVSLTRTAPC